MKPLYFIVCIGILLSFFTFPIYTQQPSESANSWIEIAEKSLNKAYQMNAKAYKDSCIYYFRQTQQYYRKAQQYKAADDLYLDLLMTIDNFSPQGADTTKLICKELEKSNETSNLAWKYLFKAGSLINDPDSSMFYFTKGKEAALLYNVPEALAYSYLSETFGAYLSNDMKKAKLTLDTLTTIFDTKLTNRAKQKLNLYYNIRSILAVQYGDYELSEQVNLNYIDILQHSKYIDTLTLAITYGNLAACYDTKKDYYKAIEYHQKSIDIREQMDYTHTDSLLFFSNLWSSYYNLAISYNNAQDKKMAAAIYAKIVQKLTRFPIDKITQIQYQSQLYGLYVDVYGHFGHNLCDQKKTDSAEYYLEKALPIAKKLNYGMDDLLLLRSTIDLETGNYKAAIESSKKTIAEMEKIYGANYRHIYLPYCYLAKAYAELKQYNLALTTLNKALTLQLNKDQVEFNSKELTVANFKNKSGAFSVLHHQLYTFSAMLQQQQFTPDYFEIAQKNIDLYLDLASFLYKNLLTQQAREQFLADNYKHYEHILALSEAMYYQTKDAKHIAKAWYCAEYSKSLFLRETLMESNARTFAGVPDSLVQKELSLVQNISFYEQKLTTSLDSATKVLYTSYLTQFKEDFDKLQTVLRNSYPKYFDLKYNTEIVSLSSIQQTLDDTTTLISYFEGSQKTYIFSINRQQIAFKSIAHDSSYYIVLQAFVRSFTNSRQIQEAPRLAQQKYLRHAHQLYKWLLASAEQALKNNVIIIPDGELNYLPFESLLVTLPKDTNQLIPYEKLDYWLHHAACSYQYSATLWWQQQQAPKHNTNKQQLLGFAPTYLIPTASNRAASIKNIRQELSELKGIYDELAFLKQHFKGTFYQKEQATEQQFKQQADHYQILHLAMHNVLNIEHPEKSCLVFSESQDTSEDNILYAYEIKSLHLPAQLLLLSACETGIGKYQRGEGSISIGRSFMYAGVESLVSTLWALNDATAPYIVQNFYLNLQQQQPKHIALKTAKQQYLKNISGTPAHPIFWANFIQLGDTQAIILQDTTSLPYLFIMGIVSLIALVLIVLVRFIKHKKVIKLNS